MDMRKGGITIIYPDTEDNYLLWQQIMEEEEEEERRRREERERLRLHHLGVRVMEGEEYALLSVRWLMSRANETPVMVSVGLEKVSLGFSHTGLMEVIMALPECDKVKLVKRLTREMLDCSFYTTEVSKGEERLLKEIAFEPLRDLVVELLRERREEAEKGDCRVLMHLGCRWKGPHIGKISTSVRLHITNELRGSALPLFVSFTAHNLERYRGSLLDQLREYGYFSDLSEVL